MTLRLRVVSDHRRALGDRSSIVFGIDGGTIGRSADNDWVLPDPLRYVSAHHARVQYRDGRFFLEDLSTNGIFLNDGERAVAKLHPGGYPLQNGDMLRVGEYQIVAAIEAPDSAGREAAPADAGAAAAVPTSIHALHTLERAGQTDIGAMLNLDDLLVSETSESMFQPVDAYGQAVGSAPRGGSTGGAADSATSESAEEFEPELESETVARRIARLARAVAAKDARSAAAAPALYDVQTGLQAFCRGAGVDAEKLSADSQTRMLHLAGQLFREALVGFKELERARHEVRNRFRIEIQSDPEDTRPSLARLTLEELIIELLHRHETRSLDAVQWLRETVDEARIHENAFSQAMRAGFVEFLDRLDPAELEARFERAARRGKARSADKAQYWDLFTTFYRNLIEMPADHLPHTFIEAFGTAYRDCLKKPQ